MWERKKKKVDFISVLLSFYKIILHAKLVCWSFWCKMYEKKINGIVFSPGTKSYRLFEVF